MKNLLIGLFTIFFFHEQDTLKTKIIGDWQGVDKVLIEKGDTVDYTLNQKGYMNDDRLSFKENGQIIVFPETHTTYEIIDKQLRMGNRIYTIEKLDNSYLILSIDALGDQTRFFLKFAKLKNEQ